MKAAELREMTLDELRHKETELKRKLFNLRFQRAAGELGNAAEFKRTRRDIARVKTIATEKAREVEG